MEGRIHRYLPALKHRSRVLRGRMLPRYHSAMLDDDAIEIQFDPPDPERVHRNYLETCRRLGMKLALLIAVAAMSPPALAGDVYRCQDAAGKIEFRDRPCDVGHKAQKVDVTPNIIETMTLEEVRAKSAELKAKQLARQSAENEANADAYVAQERAWQQERALQDAIDRDSGANAAQTQYYGGYYAGKQPRPHAKRSPLPPLSKASAMPTPPPPPKTPAMPTPPPRPLGSG
jgi:hypothetical protein